MDKISVTMPIHEIKRRQEEGWKAPLVQVHTDDDLVDDEDFNGWVSFFDNNNRASEWKEGMEVEVQLFKKESGGREYWNIYMPGRMDRLEERLEKLEKEVFKKKVSVVEEPPDDVLPF